MLAQPTIEKLIKMRLKGMARCYQSQTGESFSQLSFDERFSIIVDYEETCRQNRRLERLIKEAHFKEPACVEDINYQHPRGLNKSVMSNLISGQWMLSCQNVLITGPTGIGKTFIICALGNNACRNGFSVRYYRISKLLNEINISRGNGSYPQFLNKLAKTNLLLLDDWGLAVLNQAECRDLLEIIDDRVKASSTIISSQLPVEHWHSVLAEPSIADAILDRIIHNSHKINIKGESMRKTVGKIEG